MGRERALGVAAAPRRSIINARPPRQSRCSPRDCSQSIRRPQPRAELILIVAVRFLQNASSLAPSAQEALTQLRTNNHDTDIAQLHRPQHVGSFVPIDAGRPGCTCSSNQHLLCCKAKPSRGASQRRWQLDLVRRTVHFMSVKQVHANSREDVVRWSAHRVCTCSLVA
jgi:hypothetical protein